MNKFNVGDVVVWKENLTNSSANKGDTAKVEKVDLGMLWVSWQTRRGQMNGWYSIGKFEHLEKPFNPLKDPWYILTPTKEAYDDAVAWANGLGINTGRLPAYVNSTYYVRYFGNQSLHPKYGDMRISKEHTSGHKQITLTKSISYEYNIVEEETEEQKEVKKKAEEINAVRIEMEALAKRLKDLEG